VINVVSDVIVGIVVGKVIKFCYLLVIVVKGVTSKVEALTIPNFYHYNSNCCC
jgi:hypothetical protein